MPKYDYPEYQRLEFTLSLFILRRSGSASNRFGLAASAQTMSMSKF